MTTSKPQHTPGPWQTRDGQEIIAGASETRLVAQCHAGHREERAANARLVAAAPELLAACEFMARLQFCHRELEWEEGQGRLAVAIAKATGT